MVRSGYLRTDTPCPENVDEAVLSPAAWLAKHQAPGRNLRKPREARAAVSCLRVDKMKSNSRSFDKFYREVKASFSQWLEDSTKGD